MALNFGLFITAPISLPAMFFHLCVSLIALVCVRAAHLPSATAAPSPTVLTVEPTLAPRCEDGNCNLGNSAITLQAATVTTTIMSVTSVPCYTTVYVTQGTTTTQTIYSTETVTKTETKSGTVYVVMYSPTPVIMSSTFTSVLKITQTFTSFWTTQTGSAGTKTVSQDFGGGGGGGGCDACEKGSSGGKGGGAAIPPANQGKSYDAWTHANAGNAVQTGGGGWSANGGRVHGGSGAVVWSAGVPVAEPRLTHRVLVAAMVGLSVLIR